MQRAHAREINTVVLKFELSSKLVLLGKNFNRAYNFSQLIVN